jgi:hypothetical protein
MAKSLSAYMRAWVEQNQGRHICGCGCGGLIPVKNFHHWQGIPRFLSGHCQNPVRSAEERFWSEVRKEGACWVFDGRRDRWGYGRLYIGRRNRRTAYTGAHRFSYQLHCGPVSDGLLVLHRCDNPPCVNPAHLFLGTHQANMKDMVAKGRHKRPRRRLDAPHPADAQ